MKFKRWKLARTPEATLRRTMDAMNIDVEELAMRAALPMTRLRQAVEGVVPITDLMAEGLERAVGEPWPWWREAEIDPEEQ